MAGQTVASKAIEMLISYYKDREMKLAEELVKKYGYKAKELSKIQGVAPKAGYQYYKPLLKK